MKADRTTVDKVLAMAGVTADGLKDLQNGDGVCSTLYVKLAGDGQIVGAVLDHEKSYKSWIESEAGTNMVKVWQGGGGPPISLSWQREHVEVCCRQIEKTINVLIAARIVRPGGWEEAGVCMPSTITMAEWWKAGGHLLWPITEGKDGLDEGCNMLYLGCWTLHHEYHDGNVRIVLKGDDEQPVDVSGHTLDAFWRLMVSTGRPTRGYWSASFRIKTLTSFAGLLGITGAEAILVPLRVEWETAEKELARALEQQDDSSSYPLTFLDPDPTDAEKA